MSDLPESSEPEPYVCPLDTDTKTILKLYLFKEVKNVEEIRANIIKGVWNCAVIKPSLILDPFQVAVAANRAVVSEQHKSMVTRTVYGEILYNLSLTKNISQSLSKFGIEKGEELLVCFLVTIDKDESVEILPQIKGVACPVSALSEFTNMKEIRSAYKLNNLDTDDHKELLDNIVSRMLTKNFVSY